MTNVSLLDSCQKSYRQSGFRKPAAVSSMVNERCVLFISWNSDSNECWISSKHSAVVGTTKFCQLCSETIRRTSFPLPGMFSIAHRSVVLVPFSLARDSRGFDALWFVMCVGIENVSDTYTHYNFECDKTALVSVEGERNEHDRAKRDWGHSRRWKLVRLIVSLHSWQNFVAITTAECFKLIQRSFKPEFHNINSTQRSFTIDETAAGFLKPDWQ